MNEMTTQISMVLAQLAYLVILLVLGWPEFETDNEAMQKEIKWVFVLLLFWHIFVTFLQMIEHGSGYTKPVPWTTILMIIQLSFSAY